MPDRFRFLSDAEYGRLKEIRERHTSNDKDQTAFDVGYLIAIIFRLKDRLERGPTSTDGLFSHKRSTDV